MVINSSRLIVCVIKGEDLRFHPNSVIQLPFDAENNESPKKIAKKKIFVKVLKARPVSILGHVMRRQSKRLSDELLGFVRSCYSLEMVTLYADAPLQ